jgi:tetraacyldisaccharide 4'-kinase
LIDSEGGSFGLEAVRAKKVGAFCGIGNPEGFRRSLDALGLELAGFRTFPDHHAYTAEDVASLADWLRSVGAEVALTTQKDLVKLRALSLGPAPLHALRIGLEVMEGLEVLEQALASLVPSGKESP